MPLINVSNVLVDFPFEPYPCQLDYMTSLLSALQNREHALLESPTGTGKTLCLLCASLAWQENYKGRAEFQRGQARRQKGAAPLTEIEEALIEAVGSGYGDSHNAGPSSFRPTIPKIIFASRTHSQLSQAIQQLRNTAFKTCKVAVVGSREQLCLHEEVRHLDTNAAKVLHCRMRVRSSTCEYYRNFESNKMSLTINETKKDDTILDIEDLVSFGRERRCCPYYLARELKTSADIIFMPYNYLLDARIRRRHNIELENAVVIFDEAHNIEKTCEDSASVELSSTDIAMAIEELRQLGEELHSLLTEIGDKEWSKHDALLLPETHLGPVLALKAQLLEFEKAIDRLEVASDGLVRPGDYIFDLLQEAEISVITYTNISSLIDKILKYVTGSSNHRLRRAGGLTRLDAFLQAVFVGDSESENKSKMHSFSSKMAAMAQTRSKISAFYRVFIRDTETRQGGRQRLVCYWCFSPGRAMSELLLQGVHSLILTSGTLYPLESFKTGLGVSFNWELRSSHVIQKDQLWIGALTRSPNGIRLNSSYESRSSVEYQTGLGYSIANLAKVIPSGLLVFFPSYTLLSSCLSRWKAGEEEIYSRISQHKPVIVEPRGKIEFQQAMEEYEKKIRDPALSGAIFLGVARGKVSEGLDFANQFGRAVVITGLPFAPCMDPRVKLKMAYLDETRVCLGEGQTGRAWYKQDAWRAVNQAIGRVIRHAHDYGAIILCDERFASPDSRAQLPSWMSDAVQIYHQFGGCIRDLAQFFRQADERYPCTDSAMTKPIIDAASKSSDIRRKRTITNIIPAASQRAADKECLGPSLRFQHPETVETVRFAIDYATPSTEQPTDKTGGLMGLLDRHDAALSVTSSHAKRQSLSTASQASSDPLERRLEQLQKRRRIAVKVEDSGSPADEAFGVKEYVKRVKEAFANHTEKLRQFQSASEAYKHEGNLDDLKRELVDIFVLNDMVELAKQFSVFIKGEHKNEFARFCEENLGVERETTREYRENKKESKLEITCAKCGINREEMRKMRSGDIMLVALCGDVCCFPCWREIIENGNKRCPKCRAFVRRRNLSRVKFT